MSHRSKFAENRRRRQRPVNVARLNKTLPHSVEAEEYLLSCCLLDGADTLQRCVRAGVAATDFYVPANGVLFDLMLGLLGEHEVVDIAVLAEELKAQGKLDEVGGVAYLTQITKLVPTTAQAPYFIDKVRDLARDRARARLASELLEVTLAGDAERTAEIEEQLQNLSRKRTAELPPILDFGGFVPPEQSALPPELVKGVLHQGAKMMVAGGSKSFKTWVLLDLGLSVATGLPWWGMATEKGPVLYVNMEIAREFCEQRVRAIKTAKNFERADGFDSWHLRGYARDFSELMPIMLRAIAGRKYRLIILDPVYKILGDRDENANGEVAGLLNEFEALSVRTGAAIAYGHHHTKGNQADKNSLDRASGAGAWTRDPDALVDLTPHSKDDHFSVNFTLRNLPSRAPMVVEWKFPCMSIAPGLNPADLRKPGRPQSMALGELVDLLDKEPCGLSYTQWEKEAVNSGISKATFARMLNEAKSQGLIDKNLSFYVRKKP